MLHLNLTNIINVKLNTSTIYNGNAENLKLNSVQVKKDIAVISSSSGKPKVGFKLSTLIHDIENFLGYRKEGNIRDNFNNYCELVEKLEKYQINYEKELTATVRNGCRCACSTLQHCTLLH